MVYRAYHKVLIIFFLSLLWGEGITSASSLIVTDKLGRKVIVEVPVKRAIIGITYELIPAFDLWGQIAGVSRWAENFCSLYRAEITANPGWRRPTVGEGTDLNIEMVLKLKPDLVITWTYNPQLITFLENKGVKVIGIYPENLDETYQLIRLHGRLFGKEKRAFELISEMEKVFNIIRTQVAKIPSAEKKRVIYLGGKPTTVSAGIGVTNDVINLIGGRNPAGTIPERNIEVPIERIIAWNPQVIFIWGNAGYSAEWILKSSQWRSVVAVKEGKVYKAPEWSTWSPRLALYALWMAMKVYPEYFRDINFEDEADKFYRTVFGISYYKVKAYEKEY
jgi:iron complex transport system substrate-binding protein